MMGLNHLGRVATDRDTFDDVGIKSALSKKFVTAMGAATILLILRQQLFRRVLKDFDEFVTDDFAFLLRINHPAQEGEKTLGGIDVFELYVKIFLEDPLDNFFFAGPEQSVIDEDAGQLITNGFVQQGRDHRGINAAAESTTYFMV